MTEQTGAPKGGPRFAMGDEVSARIEGRVTAITEYGNGYYSYRITGKEPTGDRYNKFVDEQFVERAADSAVGPEAANDNLPAPATRAA